MATPQNRTGRSMLACVLALGCLGLVSCTTTRTPEAGPCGPPVTSVIACENLNPGTPPSDWKVQGSGDPALQGYATEMSVRPGDVLPFKVAAMESAYHVDLLRVGYYQGNGARKVASLPGPFPVSEQPPCASDADTGLVDCGNWSESFTWTVPADAVSGLYFAHLVRDDTGDGSLVPFVVRDETSHSDLVVQTSDETWQAYNDFGGNSLYACTSVCPPGDPLGYKSAFKVSYNRPFSSAGIDNGASWPFATEMPMISFLEANGYDVSYLSGGDVDARGSLLLDHKVFVSSGHDEYWTAAQRANVESARDHGVSLAFFSGNEVFWKTRWEPDGAGASQRTLVAYKDTHLNAATDPVDWTGTWRDPRFRPGQPENALTGQLFTVNAGTTDIQVPGRYAAIRLWRNTAVASLGPEDTATLGEGLGTLGYEWDTTPDNGFRPPGLIEMSSTTSDSAQVFTDYGSNVADNRTATHHLTLYRAPSGALVFGAGTVQWAWGLDANSPAGGPTDRTMQQATVNLLADMGAQPVTLLAGLAPAYPPAPAEAPTASIAGSVPSTVADGTPVTLSGSASAAPGAVVAGVEVSTDGGSSWHPAPIDGALPATSWTYSWVAHGHPEASVKVRAVDDAGRIGSSTSTGVAVTCPCSVWGDSFTPSVVDSDDPLPVEVGTRFTADVAGTVDAVRFYKAPANTGPHQVSVWSGTGELLGTATSATESESGWQQVQLDTPVPVAAGTTYVVSYHAPDGHYSADGDALNGQPSPALGPATVTDSPPLHVLRSTPTAGNGVYAYGTASAFPTETFFATNYWVDVAFTPTP
jgi:hypothetical protein